MNASISLKVKVIVASCLSLVASFLLLGSSTFSVFAEARPAAAEWVYVPSPNADTSNGLRAVSALAPNDVWAVGQSQGSALATLTEHWDGTQWTRIQSPNAGSIGSGLSGVAAISPTDVWAVGDYTVAGGSPQTLVEHWNGSTWSIVPSPFIQGGSLLNAVAAVSANDIWAVGNQAVGAPGPTVGTLIAHWNGSSWQSVPSPNVGDRWNDLRALTVISPDDIWAVGSTRYLSEAYQALIVHWDGSNWSLVIGPSVSFGTQLFAVAGVSSNDVWASGVDLDSGGIGHPLFLHYTGSEWNSVPSPGGVLPCLGCYGGLTAIASNDVWAVGGTFAHWDGTSWSSVAGAPVPGASNVTPLAVDAISSTDIWAVGSYNQGTGSSTLTERWQEQGSVTPTATRTASATATVPAPTATRTATATATANAGSTATNTAVAATGTATQPTVSTATSTSTATMPATVTPTACSIQFTDVPPGSSFYPYIQCLACAGIISGYSDGTFRPNTNVTRGQAAKIVANSAGYAENIPPTQQTFSDVAPNSPFWVYIERVAAHGAISGYSDGTFRPGNNVTRGQFAKIDAEVKGYSEVIPTTQQTFSDVAPLTTFWVYIERVALHNVVSGYSDGTFRPNNNVTRGQASRIVGNTFFPGCAPSARP